MVKHLIKAISKNPKLSWVLIVVTFMLVAILAYKAYAQEGRTNEEFYAKRLAERLKQDYEALLAHPSVDGINTFINKYPNDVRNGELILQREELMKLNTETRLHRRLRRNAVLPLDSLWHLKKIASTDLRYEFVDNILRQRWRDEILNKTEAAEVERFVADYPQDHVGIDSMYSRLELTYFYKAIDKKTHRHCLEYLKVIPPKYHRQKELIIQILDDLERLSLHEDDLLGKTFTGDPLTTQAQIAPIRAKFFRSPRGALSVDLVIGQMAYINARVTIHGGKLDIIINDDNKITHFSTLQYYPNDDSPFLESLYGSQHGYLHLDLTK